MTNVTNSASDLTLLSTLLLGAAGNDRLERIRLIASNYNDADLVRLRLQEGKSAVDVSHAQELSDGEE